MAGLGAWLRHEGPRISRMPSIEAASISYFHEDHPLLGATVRSLLLEERKRATSQIVLGGGVTDFAQYRELVGKIRGLDLAIDICDEAEKSLNAR